MKHWLSLFGMTVLLLAAPNAAFAAEDAKASTPAGIGLLILVLGITAILIVGGYYVRQNQMAAEADKKAQEQ